MCNVFENLYIGGLDDACNQSLKLKLNITCILTVESRPLSQHVIKGLTYHYVHLLDTEDSDLLSHLNTCLDFIHEGRQQGAVLVHCHAGQSRSGSVVVAFLMKQLTISLDEALSYAKKMKPDICPNNGFLSQLRLFEKMGYELDTDHVEYKTFKLKILSSNIQSAQNCNSLIESYLNQSKHQSSNQAVYKCKKCRYPLFFQSSVLIHSIDDKSSSGKVFKNKSTHHGKSSLKTSTVLKHSPNGPTNTSYDQCSTSIFVEPVAWMKDFLHELTGKFSCPKCSSKIGSWDWIGSQCSCGKWQTPSFHIAASKVDLVNYVPPKLPLQDKSARTNYVFKD